MRRTKPQNLQKTFHSILQISSTINHLKQIHCRLVLLELNQDQFLITNFIKLLSRHFRDIGYVISIFNQTHKPNTFMFNAMIQAYSETPGFESNAILLYNLQLGIEIDPTRRPKCFTFPSLLKACVSTFSLVRPIQEIHSQITKLGTESDVYVGTTLIDSYSKCGGIQFVQNVFEEMPNKNVVSWNSMVSGLAKCGEMDSAKKLFDEMPEKNLVSWTSLISGYAQNGYLVETLDVFNKMGAAGVKPNEITMVSVLSACANLGALEIGRKIHSFLKGNDYEMDLYVGSALIDVLVLQLFYQLVSQTA